MPPPLQPAPAPASRAAAPRGGSELGGDVTAKLDKFEAAIARLAARPGADGAETPDASVVAKVAIRLLEASVDLQLELKQPVYASDLKDKPLAVKSTAGLGPKLSRLTKDNQEEDLPVPSRLEDRVSRVVAVVKVLGAAVGPH